MTDNNDIRNKIQDLINQLPKDEAISFLTEELQKLRQQQNRSVSARCVDTSSYQQSVQNVVNSQSQIITPSRPVYSTKAFTKLETK